MTENKNISLINADILNSDIANKAYDNAINPGATTLGNSINRVATAIDTTVESLLLPFDALKILNDNVKAIISDKLSKIPEDKIIPPKPYILGPTYEALRYSYNVESLREMYINLLTSSMNVDTEKFVHPSFLEIIRQLSPLDAKLLKLLTGINIMEPTPIVQIAILTKSNNVTNIYYSMGDEFDFICEDFTTYNLAIENLQRLKLVTINFDKIINKEEKYTNITESETIKGLYTALESKYSSSHFDISLKKGIISTTLFGINFHAACVEDFF